MKSFLATFAIFYCAVISHHPNPYAKLCCIIIALQHKLIELCVLLKKPGSQQCSSPPFCVWRSQQNAVCASDILCTAMRTLDCLPLSVQHTVYSLQEFTRTFQAFFFSWQNCVFFKCTRRLEYYLNWRCGAIDQHGHMTDDMTFGKTDTIANWNIYLKI